jgi:hypothetical protein
MHYIGMDTHISNLDFAVINDAGRQFCLRRC